MLEIGSVIDGKYKILNKIGQGGMSVVYLAMNERVNKQWAVKEVRKDNVKQYELVKQGFMAEMRLLKKLRHPYLPSIVDVIDYEDAFLIVMDYIEGQTLGKVVEECGAQAQTAVILWARQLCSVLIYLHSRKPPVIYRDMKPSNIMLKPDGQIMLIDFGTAREFKETVTEDTTCLGTRGYAAPEQYGGSGQTDARTDIYCLGTTLYHLLTGHNPGEPPYEIYPIRYWNRDLSSGLEEIILKCTQKNPQDRYQSCSELLYDLEHYQELELEYKRIQNIKWRSFLCCIGLTMISGAGTAGFYRAEKHIINSTYEAYLEDAQSLAGMDAGKCIEAFEKAINLNPERGEAYNGLLDFFLWQNHEKENIRSEPGICVFSPKEEQNMRKVLGVRENSGKSNEQYLKTNPEAYEEFAYNLGIAYFYSYNGTGNKAASKKWLQIAADGKESEKLPSRNLLRAGNLYKIASYYDNLGLRNQAGDSRFSYFDFWKDLVLMTEAGDSNVSILLAYKELIVQTAANTARFREAGITEKQIKTQLKKAENVLDTLKIDRETANAEYEQELRERLKEGVAAAKEGVNAVFHTSDFR